MEEQAEDQTGAQTKAIAKEQLVELARVNVEIVRIVSGIILYRMEDWNHLCGIGCSLG